MAQRDDTSMWATLYIILYMVLQGDMVSNRMNQICFYYYLLTFKYTNLILTNCENSQININP